MMIMILTDFYVVVVDAVVVDAVALQLQKSSLVAGEIEKQNKNLVMALKNSLSSLLTPSHSSQTKLQ